jgi:Tol biopolymer transport system component
VHDEFREAVQRAGMELPTPRPDVHQVQRRGMRALVVRRTGVVVFGMALFASFFALYPSLISDRKPSDLSVGPSGGKYAEMEIAVSVIGPRKPVTLLDPDSGQTLPIAFDARAQLSASWSPDGTTLAIEASRDQRGDQIDLVTLKPDGSDVRWLTNNPEAEMMPAWAPNGDKIAFSKNAGGGNGEVFVIGASGGSPVQLTDKFAPDYFPSWSPDGSRIGLTSNVRGIIDIYAMDADGSNILQITNGGYDEGAVWSPVDELLAFIRKPSHQNSEVGDIYLVRSDGTGLERITNESALRSHLAWSPDGQQIAYCQRVSDFGPNQPSELRVMNANGGADRRLLSLDGRCTGISWRRPQSPEEPAPQGEDVQEAENEADCRPSVDVGEITGDGGRHTTKALTPNVEIASGEQQGLDWSLCAYRAMVTVDGEEPEPALCEEFSYGSGRGSGGACSVGVSATVPSHWHYFQRSSDPTEEEGVAFTGAISERVDKVVLQLDDGSDLEARIYEPPKELGVNYRFFVGFAPQGSDVIVVVLDAEGNELEREAWRGRP